MANAVAKSFLLTESSDGKKWSAWPAGDKPSGISILGHNLLADNETEGVSSRTLAVTGVGNAGALILSWVMLRTAIFTGPPTASNGNTYSQEQSQDYSPDFANYSLRTYSIVAAAGTADHNLTVAKSSGNAEELTIAILALSGGTIGTRKSIVNRSAAGAGHTHTSGTVTMTGPGILVAFGSGTGNVNATAPTQTWQAGWTVHRSVARSSAVAPSGHVPFYLATKEVFDAGTYGVDVQTTINEGIVIGLIGVQP